MPRMIFGTLDAIETDAVHMGALLDAYDNERSMTIFYDGYTHTVNTRGVLPVPRHMDSKYSRKLQRAMRADREA